MHIHKIFAWTVVVIWMILIFNLSSQAAKQSNQLSKGITEIIVKTVEKVAPNVAFDLDSFNHIVRKNAHFIAYLILGILVINALRKSDIYTWQSVVWTLLICFLYAVSDEVHQLFVSGRSGQVKDVMIDSAGTIAGIVIYGCFTKYLVPSWNQLKKCLIYKRIF